MINIFDDFNFKYFPKKPKKDNDSDCYFEFIYEPTNTIKKQNEILELGNQILEQNEKLKRQLLVEKTIAECMAKLRRKGK